MHLLAQALPVYTQKFKAFQNDNDAAPFKEIKGIVEDALGCPLEEVFESFEGTVEHLLAPLHCQRSDWNRFCGRVSSRVRIDCSSSQGSPATRMGCWC